MVVVAADNLSKNGGSSICSTSVIIIEVATNEVGPRADIDCGQEDAVCKDIQSVQVINHGITGCTKMIAYCGDSLINWVYGGVVICIVATEPKNKVTNVEIHEEERGREVVSPTP